MNLINAPEHPIQSSPQGRISITMGKIAVAKKRYKARWCHYAGTEVIGSDVLIPRSQLVVRNLRVSQSGSVITRHPSEQPFRYNHLFL